MHVESHTKYLLSSPTKQESYRQAIYHTHSRPFGSRTAGMLTLVSARCGEGQRVVVNTVSGPSARSSLVTKLFNRSTSVSALALVRGTASCTTQTQRSCKTECNRINGSYYVPFIPITIALVLCEGNACNKVPGSHLEMARTRVQSMELEHIM